MRPTMLGETPSPLFAWLTGDDEPGALVCRRVFCPSNYWFALYGALEILGTPENWEQAGTTTPDEIAEAFALAMVETMKGGGCVNPGEVFFYAGTVAPSNALVCDGSSLLRADYPALFSAIGTV